MASRLLSLTAIGIASLLVTLTPVAPTFADEDPGYRGPRVRTAPAPQRVRTITNTRTVWRTRTICYDYNGQPFDCRAQAPAVQQYVLVGYTYGSSCGGCASAPVAQYVPPLVPRYSGCGGCAPAAGHLYGHGYGYGHPGYGYGRPGYGYRGRIGYGYPGRVGYGHPGHVGHVHPGHVGHVGHGHPGHPGHGHPGHPISAYGYAAQ